MSAETLLKNYGFTETKNGLWTIGRSHSGFRDESSYTREDSAAFRLQDSGRWRLVDETGQAPALNFETGDVRDVIAYAQTIIASSVFDVSGVPLDEGFEFDGTFYSAPYMFGDYFDFHTAVIGKEIWIGHPDGEFGQRYREWRDDFAGRIEQGLASAPDEYRVEPATVPSL
jgi:hypothetical protein